jgi:hypothetical protein
VVRVLQAHSGVPVPANPLSHTLPG